MKNFFKLAFVTVVLISLNACSTGSDPVIDNSVKTDGSLAITAKTNTYNGQYAPSNVVAIWIESSGGTFVKTIMVRAAARKQYLTNWMKASSNGNTTDASTGATVSSHTTYSLTWNGKNSSGTTVGDGAYNLCVEFTENNGTGKLAKFSFNKGTSIDSQSPATSSNVSNVTLKWTPTGL